MNGDFLFFVFFLLIFITGMIFRGVFGRRSPDFKKSGRELIQQAFEHESRLSMALQFLMGISIMIGMITYLFFTPLFPWLQLPLPDLVRWIGVVLDIASVDELPEKLLRVTNYLSHWRISSSLSEGFLLTLADPELVGTDVILRASEVK